MRGGAIHDRITFVILCNASIKRNGQPATTGMCFTLHLHLYFQVEKQRLTYIRRLNEK